MKKGILAFVLTVFVIHVYAQGPLTEVDALRFGRSYGLQGTAASVGKAGAIGALGGDLSSMSSNPAGLGLFSRSEISYSPMWQWNNNKASYEGMKNYHDDHSGRFGTFSAVFSHKFGENSDAYSSGFRGIQFGIGKNRLNQFDNRYSIRGKSTKSAADEWLYLADQNGFFDYRVDLANLAGLIFYDTAQDNYWTPIDRGELVHKKKIREEGGTWDYNISFATNFEDILYLGFGLGIPDFEYKKTSIYSEDDERNLMPDFDYFDYIETTEVEGTGYNFKFGAIVRALDWLRLGVSYHTPTYYSVDSRYSTHIYSGVFGREYTVNSNDYYDPILSYHLRTPGKFMGSLAFVFGNQSSKLAGSLSADYEYMNYSSMRYSSIHSPSDGYLFGADYDVNDFIKDTYKESHTIRIGGQLNVGKAALRAGYALFTSPYKNKECESNQYAITAGVGYRAKWCYIDLAYAYMHKKDKQLMYDSPEMDIDMKYNKSNLILTLGLRF